MTHADSPDPQNDRNCITSSCPRQLVSPIYLLAGKDRLGSIIKQGNRHLRWLLVVGATAVAQQVIVPAPAAMLLDIKGIGPEFAAILWSEGLFRHFYNRRQIASYAGSASSASRSASTALICSSSSSSRSSSRLIWTLRCIGKGRPSPVFSSSSCRRRSRRSGSYPDTPQENSKPLMRFTCLTPLRDQYLALAAKPATVLFLGSRRFDHRAHPRFAALIRQQRAKQRLAVDPVILRSSATT